MRHQPPGQPRLAPQLLPWGLRLLGLLPRALPPRVARLPALFSGEVIISVVLSIPTLGPTLLRATLAQDMYLVGSIVLILSSLTVVGTLLSDIYLAWADPRIRFESGGK